MSDILDSIDNLPDISFIDNLTLTDVQALLLNGFYDKYKQITGKKITLARGDPYRIMMLANAQILYQGLQHVDKAGKMNFLKYSYGDYLKNLAALKKVTANEPEKAYVQVRWKLAGARESATPIPAGSRITADYAVYFETLDYAEIPAGATETVITMYCTETGEQGNGYMAGELSVLVDPVAFIESGPTLKQQTEEPARRPIRASRRGHTWPLPAFQQQGRMTLIFTTLKATARRSGTFCRLPPRRAW